MITISERAKSKLVELMQEKDAQDMALRVVVAGRGPGGFHYSLGFVPPESRTDDDTLVELDGLSILIDAASATHMQGAKVDYLEEGQREGFKIDNPNPLWTDPLAQRVQEVIDSQINPGIAGHGGFVTLLDVKEGTAYVQFGGGCQGCSMVDATLKGGVEVMLREAVPEIERVLDTTDHAGGTNPYYRDAHGGRSPVG